MAQITDGFNYTGGLGNISAYKMRGSDKIILRTKGGPSKKQIKSSPNFAATRKNNSEWTGCTKAGQIFRTAIFPIRGFADYNISGPINGIAKIAQKLDTENELGKRSICFSKFKELFEGFNLNKSKLFSTVVQVPISVTTDRQAISTSLSIPAIWPPIQLDNAYNYPWCRFVVSLGVISDVVYDEKEQAYVAAHATCQGQYEVQYTEWKSTKERLLAEKISFGLEGQTALEDCDSLVIGIGIEFGSEVSNQVVVPVKYSGSGKVLKIG